MRCRLSACSPTVAAPRGKKCPLYQEGGARDVHSSSDASKGCSLAILETQWGHPQESGLNQSWGCLLTRRRRSRTAQGLLGVRSCRIRRAPARSWRSGAARCRVAGARRPDFPLESAGGVPGCGARDDNTAVITTGHWLSTMTGPSARAPISPNGAAQDSRIDDQLGPHTARNLTSDAGGGPRAARHGGGSIAGLTSTTGVPSIASRASTSIRSPSRATMRARCRPMGLGRLGEQVLNTPVSGWLMSP